MTLSNDELLARFAVEHFDRHSITQARRQEVVTLLLALAVRLEGRPLTTLTPADLMTWQAAEIARGLAPSTVKKRENMIRAFVSWAGQVQLMSFEATGQLKSVTAARGTTVVHKPKPYKRAEIVRFRELLEARYPLAPASGRGSRMVKRFLQGKSPLTRAVYRHARRLQMEAQVSLALEEGLRVGEIWRLTLPQMHPDNAGVVVITAKSKPGERREREVPYTNHSRLCVQEWLDFRSLMAPHHERPWLRLREDDPRGELGYDSFRKSLQKFGRPYYRWHRFRHTFATERLRAGMPLEQLQVMMGHANLTQTLAYAEIVNADVQAEADRTADAFAENLGLALV